jgi:hypothetical protein
VDQGGPDVHVTDEQSIEAIQPVGNSARLLQENQAALPINELSVGLPEALTAGAQVADHRRSPHGFRERILTGGSSDQDPLEMVAPYPRPPNAPLTCAFTIEGWLRSAATAP